MHYMHGQSWVLFVGNELGLGYVSGEVLPMIQNIERLTRKATRPEHSTTT